MNALPAPASLEDLRQRLRLMRIYIAQLDAPVLSDLDSLLSVAEAEVERALSYASREQDGLS
jgi:hypothetical protein